MKTATIVKIVIGVPLGIFLGIFMLLFVMLGCEELKKDNKMRNRTHVNFLDAVCDPHTSNYALESWIDKGADVNQLVPMEGQGQVPLIKYASANCTNVDGVRLILRRGARIEDASLAGAVSRGDEEMARMLIDEGASLGKKQAAGADDPVATELLHAAIIGNQAWLVQRLVERGQSVKGTNAQGESLLQMVLTRHRVYANTTNIVPLVKVLIAAGAPANMPGEALLALVLQTQDRRDTAVLLKMLIAAGAHVNPLTDKENPALYWAAFDERKEDLELLLAAGAKVDALVVSDVMTRTVIPPGASVTALSSAVEQCQFEAVDLLLKKGAAKSVVISDGRSLTEGVCRYNDRHNGKREKILALLAK
jgi:ankyrin repeat protein